MSTGPFTPFQGSANIHRKRSFEAVAAVGKLRNVYMVTKVLKDMISPIYKEVVEFMLCKLRRADLLPGS